MPKFERHIFICTNERAPDHPRGSCGAKGSADLQLEFKTKLGKLGLAKRVRANKSGCLDQCEHGPTVVVYPDAVWYGRVQLSDVDEIIESHVLNGKAVERLILPNSCLNCYCEHRKPKVKQDSEAGTEQPTKS